MNTIHRKRLIWMSLITLLVAAAIALSLYALRQNINLFFVPSEIVQGKAPEQQTIRVGGWVVPGSIVHAEKHLSVRFMITDHKKNLSVIYDGLLPDLFREGQAVVVEGALDQDHILQATQVLAKHDENYTPPQLATK